MCYSDYSGYDWSSLVFFSTWKPSNYKELKGRIFFRSRVLRGGGWVFLEKPILLFSDRVQAVYVLLLKNCFRELNAGKKRQKKIPGKSCFQDCL
jgi:hypothetical protein